MRIVSLQIAGTLDQAAEAAVNQWPASPDAALDAFIRQLNPGALPPGVLELRTSSLRLPQVGFGQKLRQEIEIANRGRGYLHGEIFSSRPWVKVGSGVRGGNGPGRRCRAKWVNAVLKII